MNIAYIVIAWNRPGQLKRMVDRLDQPNVHFYIHIDKKKNDLDTYTSLFAGRKNVTVVSEYEVYWGGISQVKTAQHLLKMAINGPMPFKYYVLLSGQDYPIKSNAYINEFFSNHSCDFMAYNRIADLHPSFTDKYRHYHYLDFKYVNPKEPGRSKLLSYLYFGFNKRIAKYLPQRKFYKDFIPYFGSDWLALSHDTLKYILDFTAAHKDYMQFMTYTDIPSELYIHNIVLNSERKTNLCDYPRFVEWLKNKKDGDIFHPEYSSLRYMDWSDKGKGASKPAILDISYFDDLKKDKNLFARKVDDTISAELLDRIDAELL